MKKCTFSFLFLIALFVCCCASAHAEDNDEWKTMPVITSVYESAKGKVSLEWNGSADLYQVSVDGKVVDTVNIRSSIIEVKPGSHKIIIIPVKFEQKNVNTEISLPDISLPSIIGGTSIGGGSVDLAAFGLDPKDLVQGTHSDPFKLNYTPSKVFDAKPSIQSAATDFADNVVLCFTDNYDSDVYSFSIKSGKDIAYVDFDTTNAEAIPLILKEKSSVSIILDQNYLAKHGCSIIPDLNQKYSFSVKLRKWPIDLASDVKERSSFLDSKESAFFDFTPFAAWKYAPEITYHSQTADGEITLCWTHDDNNIGCEYKVIRLDKILVVKKGQEVVGTTAENEFVVKDLSNGKYTFVVVPVFSSEEGERSEEINEEVKNEWVIAPTLVCDPVENRQILLRWENSEGIENYHVTVFLGSGSLLRFVNLDYKKVDEFDIQNTAEITEYLYELTSETSENTRLKFEVYGVRHTASGELQQSATSTQTVVLK